MRGSLMANGVNLVTLIGYVGKDPKITTMQSGDVSAMFSLATSKSWPDKRTGEKKEQTQWHNLVAYRKVAEIISKYVFAGDRLYIQGELQYGKYDDNQGITRYTTQIVVDQLQMLSAKGENRQKEAPQEQKKDYKKGKEDFPPLEDFDDDVPF